MARDYQLNYAARLGGDIPPWSEDEARLWAGELLGGPVDADGCAPCPGAHLHSTRDARKDFRVFFTGRVPAGVCMHQSCVETVLAFNKGLWRRLFAKRAGGPMPAAIRRREEWEPRAEGRVKKRQPFDIEALKREASRVPFPVDADWLRSRSPIDPRIVGPGMFLGELYKGTDRALIFVNEYSQGDFGFVPGRGFVRLGQRREEGNKPDDGLTLGRRAGWKYGVWFLAQPVDGCWHKNAQKFPDRPWSRRREDAVSGWRFMVLESDDAPPGLWLRLIVQLEVPIVALYSSGGKSIHALVRVDAGSKGRWDMIRDAWSPVLTTLGADGATMTAVRLTRLPGCWRRGKAVAVEVMGPDGLPEVDARGRIVRRNEWLQYPRPLEQKLLFFNPAAIEGEPIIALPPQRIEVEAPPAEVVA